MAYKIKSKKEYQKLKQKYEAHLKHPYWEITKRNWINDKEAKKYGVPKGTTHEETSSIEVYEFKNKKNKGKYTAYMSSDRKKLGTWTGEKLADITYLGNEYSTGVGTRQNFRAKGIDGRNWSGTFFVSSGDYVNMKVVK